MDHDDSMLSTPSSHGNDDTYDEENLFPEEPAHSASHTSYIAAETPQNDHLNAAAPGELSPPRSQSVSNTNTQPNGLGTAISHGDIPADLDGLSDDEGVDLKGERSKTGQDEKSKPGWGWKTKKAQEDMQRAWEHMVDRDFAIKQFGDVLAGQGG